MASFPVAETTSGRVSALRRQGQSRPGYAQPPTAATTPTNDKRRALRITQHCS